MVAGSFCLGDTFLLILAPIIPPLVPFWLTFRLPWGECHEGSHLGNLCSFLFVEMVMLGSLLEGMVTLVTGMVVVFLVCNLIIILDIKKLESFKCFCSLQKFLVDVSFLFVLPDLF